jgi:hypothetical protein
MDDDRIPSSENYRGIAVHAGQSRKRVAVVRKAIDRVCAIDDLTTLDSILDDFTAPPEARAFAGRKILAALDETISTRQTRPRGLDRGAIDGAVGALESRRWRDPLSYGTLLEPCASHVKRDRPLPPLPDPDITNNRLTAKR